jgi:hypothetical protein
MGQSADNIHRRRFQVEVREPQRRHGHRGKHSRMGHRENSGR